MQNSIQNVITWLAKLYLWRHKPIVVGVAGSVGKTSTKRVIGTVLSGKYSVFYHPGSYNSEFGLPLSILQTNVPSQLKNPILWILIFARSIMKIILPKQIDVLVLEYGVDAPGDMQRLLAIHQPDIAVLSAITPEHMEQLGDIETVAAEETAILKRAVTCIINEDDVDARWLKRSMIDDMRFYNRNSFRLLTSRDKAKKGISLQVTGRNQKYEAHNLQNIGEGIGLALSAAILVAEKLDMKPRAIQKGLSRLEPVPGRMRVLRGVKSSLIIDDSYNSSPVAVTSALKTLSMMPAKRRIVVLGAMNELGAYAPQGYAQAIGDVDKIDQFITLGAQANELFMKRLIKLGVKKSRIAGFDDPIEAGRFVRDVLNLGKGDVILVKGSQNGVYSEEAVKQILSHSEDAKLLVRQSDFWMQKKRQNFNW